MARYEKPDQASLNWQALHSDMGKTADRIEQSPGGKRFLERMSWLMKPRNHGREMPSWLR